MVLNLTEKQKNAFDAIIKGYNVFLTGPAGSGKSYLLNTIIEYFNQNNIDNVYKTSLTGISALLLKGTTLHRYAGIGLGNKSIDFYIKQIYKNKNIKNRWLTTNILIIDEISMLTVELFEKLEKIAREIRKNNKPFGGIQIIMSGDFFQLPPVDSYINNSFCFQSSLWNEVINKTFNFDEIKRQSDSKFQLILNKVRVGNIDAEVKEVLNSCLHKKLVNEYGIIPTIILSKKLMVKEHNKIEEEKLLNKKYIFKSKINHININKEYIAQYMEIFNKSIDIEDEQIFSIGSQVMLIVNKPDDNLANGSLGKIIDFENGIPIVLFLNGIQKKINPYIWYLNDTTKSTDPNISKEQLPLIPAWAITIHRAQGATLEYIITDIGDSIFEFGQAYVVLSRVKSLEGLSLLNINFKKIKANKLVVEYYNNLKLLNIK